MKKLMSLLAVVALALPAVAKQDFPASAADFPATAPAADFPTVAADFPAANPAMEAKLKEQVKAPVSRDKSVVRIEMTVVSRFENQSQEENNEVTKECAAVRIADNWLVASLTCRGTTKTATARDHYGNPYEKNVEFRRISSMTVEGVEVNAANEVFVDENSKAILIYLNPNNTKLMKKVENKKGIAPIVVANNPQALLKSIKKAFINRENFCLPGRCSAEVFVSAYCDDVKCYKVAWKLIDGEAGDPLFIQSAKNKEYLAALNVAEIDGTDVQSGRFYKAFDKDIYKFMKKVISKKTPAAWDKIDASKKTEKTF